jgi:acyl-CoA synthetase (AMP-forming)/AMP-acid ligase II/acyl carrier protein
VNKQQSPSVPVHSPVSNLSYLLDARIRQQHQNDTAFTFCADGLIPSDTLTYAELGTKARNACAQILAEPASRKSKFVIMAYPSGIAFITAWWGCVLAGKVPVPLAVEILNAVTRLQDIAKDCGSHLILTDREHSVSTSAALIAAESDLICSFIEEGSSDAASVLPGHQAGTQDTALLLYTSGSTGISKGVALTHENLLHQSSQLARAIDYEPMSKCVTWMPMYHSSGLIGVMLQTIYSGVPLVFMSPAVFIKDPLVWLKCISQFQATVSGAPSFAYGLCVRALSANPHQNLDLRTWDTAICGSDTIVPQVLEMFSSTFAPSGFRADAFFPCYGLTEATLLVSAGPKRAGLTTISGPSSSPESTSESTRPTRIASAGLLMAAQRVTIVDPLTKLPVPDGQEGEIWVSSLSVGKEYLNRPSESSETFGAKHPTDPKNVLKTGDLGLLINNFLYITGRLKELIVVRGKNHSPSEIERTAVEACSTVTIHACAAFGIVREGHESFGICVEVADISTDEQLMLTKSVRKAVAQRHGIVPEPLGLFKPGTLPRTSAGKIIRAGCRDRYLANESSGELLGSARSLAGSDATGTRQATTRTTSTSALDIVSLIVSAQLKRKAEDLSLHTPIMSYGIDSLDATEITLQIERDTGKRLSMETILSGASVADLCEALQSVPQQSSTEREQEEWRDDRLPLSLAQEAMLFQIRMHPDNNAYAIAMAFSVKEPVEWNRLQQALKLLASRHPSLRTTFFLDNDRWYQRVGSRSNVAVSVQDASLWADTELSERIKQECMKPLPVDGVTLNQFTVFSGDEKTVVLIRMHHMLTDLWSIALLGRELEQLYFCGSQAASNLETVTPYKEYLQQEQRILDADAQQSDVLYWTEVLNNLPGPISFHASGEIRPSQVPEQISVEISKEVSTRLRHVARDYATTPFVLLLAVYAKAIGMCTHRDDVVIASPTSGRTDSRFSKTPFYMAKTLPFRITLSRAASFTDLLRETRGVVLGALKHQQYSLGLSAQNLNENRGSAVSELFQLLFSYDSGIPVEGADIQWNSSSHQELAAPSYRSKITSYPIEQTAPMCDLELKVRDVGDAFACTFIGDSRLFDSFDLAMIARSFQELATLYSQPQGDDVEGALNRISHATINSMVRESTNLILPQGIPVSVEALRAEDVRGILHSMWSTLLDVPVERLSGDFFDSGGHSILIVRLAALINTKFGVQVTERQLFEGSRLDEMSDLVSQLLLLSKRPPISHLLESSSDVSGVL